MTRPVRFGVTLPKIKRTWAEARAAALEFDRLGFDSVWVCDHLYGVPLPNLPIFEAWSELAAVAAITERVELGTLVTPPFFRNPAVFAKQVATIDHVANGRVVVGLGGGWFAAEFEAYGCPFPSLGARLRALDETCAALKRLWTEERVTFEGKHVVVRDAMCEPKPVRRPRGARHLGYARAGDRAHPPPHRARLHALRDGVLRARHARARAAVRGAGAAGVPLIG